MRKNDRENVPLIRLGEQQISGRIYLNNEDDSVQIFEHLERLAEERGLPGRFRMTRGRHPSESKATPTPRAPKSTDSSSRKTSETPTPILLAQTFEEQAQRQLILHLKAHRTSLANVADALEQSMDPTAFPTLYAPEMKQLSTLLDRLTRQISRRVSSNIPPPFRMRSSLLVRKPAERPPVIRDTTAQESRAKWAARQADDPARGNGYDPDVEEDGRENNKSSDEQK